jgi:NAD(P)-dependent dehydrogenase (short-subunit alcohol dehydrogenase family)
MELKDRVAVVTGGAGGIGSALARRFAAEGAAAVTVADIDGGRAREVAAEIPNGSGTECDVASESDARRLVEDVLGQHGRIDVLASNAGIAVAGGLEEPNSEWQRIWDVNVMAHVNLCRVVVPAMRERGEGYLLFTVSAAGLLNHVAAAPYGVTKAAALSLAEWLSIAYGDDGIRVSALCPQGVRTAMLSADRSGFLDAGALEPDQVAAAVVEGLRDERFLILPHPEVTEYFGRKASDYDRWIRGMRRLRAQVMAASAGGGQGA